MRYVVIGGGVAGVSCAEELCRLLGALQIGVADEVVLVVASPSVQRVTNRVRLDAARESLLETFDVAEVPLDELPKISPDCERRLRCVRGAVAAVDASRRLVSFEPRSGADGRTPAPLAFD